MWEVGARAEEGGTCRELPGASDAGTAVLASSVMREGCSQGTVGDRPAIWGFLKRGGVWAVVQARLRLNVSPWCCMLSIE